ncbi:MAG: xanthine dehydrogenase family protein subunit M [Tissierellia bacterium]|nr:xanthine dehydrogenase family protein subunit M [Tissierellia bacterium]
MQVHKGQTLDEVVRLLDQYKDRGKLIAGGTDLIIAMRNKKINIDALIDISTIAELQGVRDVGEYISIGAATTFTQLMESPLLEENLYGLKKASRQVGSPQIRNKGTIGGNIANGSPAADSVPPLLCLDSQLILMSTRGERSISLKDYYEKDMKIEEDEIIREIQFKKPKFNQVLTFSKLGLRKALAISRLSIAILLELDGDKVKTIRVASGSLGRYPLREYRVEEFLIGKEIREEVIDEAILVLKEAMDERLKGRPTLPYKRRAVEWAFKDAIEEGVKRLKGVEAW